MVAKKPSTFYWTPEECDLLLSGVPLERVAEITGRSRDACWRRLHAMRTGELRVPFVKDWTEVEHEKMVALLKDHTVRETAEFMGRTESAVCKRMMDFKVRARVRMYRPPKTSAPMRVVKWTDDDVRSLYSWAGKITLKEAADRLGRTVGAVKRVCYQRRIRWSLGGTTASDLARETGLSNPTVDKVLHRLFPHKVPGANKRWSLNDQQADLARKVLHKKARQLGRKIR